MVASVFRSPVSARRVYALGALAAVLFGYDNGIIGAALLFIPRDLPLTPWQKGVVVSATVFGAMLGALGSGPAADRLGRQRILLAAGLVFTVGALGAGAAATVEVLVAFRFILGLGIGIASVIVPLYLAEMAPARDRGVVTSLNQYMIIVGTALSAAVGYAFAFAGSWRWMLLVGVFPAIVLMVGMVVMPDTPRSLVRRGQDGNARAVLLGLRGDVAEAERELAEIIAVERQQRDTRTAVRSLGSPAAAAGRPAGHLPADHRDQRDRVLRTDHSHQLRSVRDHRVVVRFSQRAGEHRDDRARHPIQSR
jgi:MFS family permease